MDVQTSANRFDQAVSTLPVELKEALTGIPKRIKATAFEVRLRVDRPIALTCAGQCWFVDRESQLHNVPSGCFIITSEHLSQAVVSMCAYSVHSHQQELANGYISLRGGHRAGISGTAVVSNGKINAVRDITSINLRVARQVYGAADRLVEQIFKSKLCGVLIAGVPSSGKTTILRDLARQLADGQTGRYIRVAVVDERGELGAVFEGVPQNNLGAACDILSNYPKGIGILTAVRTLSPQVIICDEIGSREEADSMLDGLNCGVKMIATAHASTVDELLRRRQIARLLEYGAFEKIVMLGDADAPGCIKNIVEAGDLHVEAFRNAAHRSLLYHDRDILGVELIGPRSQS